MGQPSELARFDAIVVGAGHNGLVAATLLGRAGKSVLVLERAGHVGGAAVSASPFAGVDARLSRFSYLVSLFPAFLISSLGLRFRLQQRRVASYTPCGETGLLVADEERTRQSISAICGEADAVEAWEAFHARLTRLAGRVFPTLTEPLRGREEFRRLVDDEEVWSGLFERPLRELVEARFASDLVRGVVLTDGLIGTFASAAEPDLRQNRCFLYHVIGNGTGRWDVPVGGMGTLSQALELAARRAGAVVVTGSEAVGIDRDDRGMLMECGDGRRYAASDVLVGAAPAVLARLLGEPPPSPAPEGSQLKLNMLLRRLPRLRDPGVSPEEAFAGTFHVNEGYEALERSFREAAAGRIPSRPPCELYCHSLSDPTILSPELQAAGAQTLTLFGLHMPARLFAADPAGAKRAAVAATLASVNSVLAEPLEGCLAVDADGGPCLEAHTPVDLEAELAMPGGHIFHRDLSWPFAECEEEVGRWGVETEHPNVWLCGAGARRGGAVSGIPGYNAAQAVLAASSPQRLAK